MHLSFLILAGCATTDATDTGAADQRAVVTTEEERALHEPDLETEVWNGEWNPPMLQSVASREGAHAWARTDVHGTLQLGDGISLYLFGEVEDVAAWLSGDDAIALAGIAIGASGACLGRLDVVDSLLLKDPARIVDRDGTLVSDDGDAWALAPCGLDAASPQLARIGSAHLSVEAQEWLASEPEDEPAPPPSCSSTCGSTQGYSYAGETAYSNGSYTGSGSACNSTDSYGYRYQCVQYTERVHHRTDWAGNAYTGYWANTGLTSSTQGPYYKGLLPLGTGTPYAGPQAGDVVTWSGGTYGHVAVIGSVGSSTITLYDQNRRCGDQSCNLTYSTAGSVFTLGNGTASGYCGAEGMTYTLKGYLHRGWDFGGTYGLASSASTAATQHNWYLNDATYYASTTSSSVSEITDYITINPGTSDPYMVSPPNLGIPAYASTATHGYRYVSVYVASNCTNKSAQLFWKRTTDSDFSSTRSVTATIVGSGWQTLRFNPSTSTAWSGTISQIRIDPASSCSSSSSDTISFQSAYFSR